MAFALKPIEIVNSGKHLLLKIHKTWSRILLKDIAVVYNGYTFKSSLFSKTGGIPLIRIRDILVKTKRKNFIRVSIRMNILLEKVIFSSGWLVILIVVNGTVVIVC